MGTWRITGMDGLGRRGPALVAALAVGAAVLAGAGPAAAAAHPGSPAAPGVRRAVGAGVISTVAGGVGGPGRATKVAMQPCGVASGGGHLYIGTETAVRQVNPATDWLTTPEGTRASLDGACAVGVGGSGNLAIAVNDRVRVVAASTGTFYGQAMTAGHIYTVAGNGKPGFSGDGGPATRAKLDDPSGVAVDGAGNLVIADTFNERVRVVAASTGTFYGRAMTAGDIYTVAGTGKAGFSGDGGPAASAELWDPSWVAVDGAGNLVIADAGNCRVRVVAASTGTFYGQAMTAGDIYTVAGTGKRAFSGDGGPAASAALSGPSGVAVDGAGNLLIADSGNGRIREVTG